MIWDQLPTIFIRNIHQCSIYQTFVLSGRCPALKPTVPDLESCLNYRKEQNEQLQAILQWCFHRPNKCSIRALIGSRNRSVSSAAGKQRVDRVMSDRARPRFRKRAKDDKHNKSRLLLLILLKWWWYGQKRRRRSKKKKKKRNFPFLKCQFFKLVPEMLPLFIATYELFKFRLVTGRILLYYSGPEPA